MSKTSNDYLEGWGAGENDVIEGWFDPADYSREQLVNHLVGRANYALDWIEGYCDAAFTVAR